MKKRFLAIGTGPNGGIAPSMHSMHDTRAAAEEWAKNQICAALLPQISIFELVAEVQTKIDFEIVEATV